LAKAPWVIIRSLAEKHTPLTGRAPERKKRLAHGSPQVPSDRHAAFGAASTAEQPAPQRLSPRCAIAADHPSIC